MTTSDSQVQKLRNFALMIIASGVVLTGLIFGSSFLLPLAIALLIWNLLEAIIDQLRRIGIGPVRVPRILAMIISICLVGIFFMIVVRILSSQVDAIAKAAPRYTERLREIFGNVVNWLGPEIANKANDQWNSINMLSRLSGWVGSARSLFGQCWLDHTLCGFSPRRK